MNKPFFILFLVSFLEACSSTTRMPSNSFQESFKHEFAMEDFIDEIPFSTGKVNPKKYLADEKEHQRYEKEATEKGILKGMTKEGCADRESGYWQICFIFDAEWMLKEMPLEAPLKNLHPTEVASIIWYADFGSEIYNKALRSLDDELLIKYELDMKLIISGLNKAKPYYGPSIRCESKGENTKAKEAAARYTVGEIFQTRSFLSTSIGMDEEYIESWIRPCRVQLNIYHHGGGALIESISSRPYEQEILVKPLTKYKVLDKVESSKDGRPFFLISLEELR